MQSNILDWLYGMNDVIDQKLSTTNSTIPDFNAADEDR